MPRAERRPVAVVTGGSRGIGARVAHALAARGHDVVVASRRVEACVALAAEIAAQHGVRALGARFDAGRWDDCDHLADLACAELGRVDVLVNNAGSSPRYDALTDVSEALFDKVLAVNLRAPFRLTALLGERMRAQGGGAIVNIGSSAAIRPDPGALPYSAAKAGLHTLTLGFAQALAPTVRVNTVQPGPILTEVANHWPLEHRARLEATVALGRCGQPDEVVGAVLYLATDDSTYTTGAVIRVDGGWP